MARAHLFRPVTDEKGNLLYGASVTVRTLTLGANISQTIWAGPLSSAPELSNPFMVHSGYIDIWLDTPERVNFLVEFTGREPISIYLDVHPPAQEVIRTAYPLTITNAPTNGTVLTGASETTASFQDMPAPPAGTAPPHSHDGDGVDSTALGDDASADGVRSTAVGDEAKADFTDATAFGYRAVAGAARATAVGAGASAPFSDSTAVGAGARANVGGTSVGQGAVAAGLRAVSVGHDAQAAGDQAVALGGGAMAAGTEAVAVGQGAVASEDGAVALGAGAQATNVASVALGSAAETSADNQVALGGPGSTVVVTGDLLGQGDARVGGVTGTLGFFGSAGTTRQTISGTVTDPDLAEVLAILAGYGFIIDNTTP